MEAQIKLFSEKENCCGCAACVNICNRAAIKMELDNEGFCYPVIDENNCVRCHRCEQVCPIHFRQKERLQENSRPHVGIINLQYTHNYGASIAAAVLEERVRQLAGPEVETQTIDYRGVLQNAGSLEQYLDQIKDANGLKSFLKRKRTEARRKDTPETKAKKAVRAQRFQCFNAKYLNRTRVYTDAADINKEIRYAAYIAGSDVIWHPKRMSSFRAEGFCLKFADKGERCISYAASIDSKVDFKLKRLKHCYRENLKKFDFISVREPENVPFIQRLTDKKVYQCCDPAFLFSAQDYEEMIQDACIAQNTENYIYVYVIDQCSDIEAFAKKLAAQKGLRICYYTSSPNEYDFGSNAQDCMTDGPLEFLHRLRYASYVLTNSFHCAVFSLLFEKQFFSFERRGSGSASIKTQNLLEQVGLADRIYEADPAIGIDDPIDYARVAQEITQMRERGIAYLKMALSNLNIDGS